MAGFTLKCLDQNADRISVQSTDAPTWTPARRKWKFLPAKGYEVAVPLKGLLVLKTRGPNEIIIVPHDSTIVIRSNRKGGLVTKPNTALRIPMADGEALTFVHAGQYEPRTPHVTARFDV